MPKIRKPPPGPIMDHLALRFREGRISIADFDELHDWLASDPDVPHGKWYKRFRRFTLAGEGDLPKTFLEPGHGRSREGSRIAASFEGCTIQLQIRGRVPSHGSDPP